MSPNLSTRPASPSRQPVRIADAVPAAAHGSPDTDRAWVQRQHQQLNELLSREPSLAALMFQGRALAELATPAGLRLLERAVDAQEYDPISMNHGIRRLRLDGYAGEIIWDYPGNPATIIERDAITETLEQEAAAIIAEVLGCVEQVDKFPDSDSLTNQGGLWSYRSFYDKSGQENLPLHEACPRTATLIKRLRPNLTFGFAFISVLDPNTTIAAHKGSTSLRQRYHLGIKIPADGVSRIRIGDTWKTWEAGKAFGFNDAIEHEVEHWSAQRRILLIVDTWSNHVPAAVIDAIRHHPSLLKLAVLSRPGESMAIND